MAKHTAAARIALTTKATTVSNNNPTGSAVDAVLVKLYGSWILWVDPVCAGAWGQFNLAEVIADNRNSRCIQFGSGWSVTNLLALAAEAKLLADAADRTGRDRTHLKAV